MVSYPLVHYGLEIVLDGAPSQEIMSKLIAIAAETPVTTIILATTTASIHSGKRSIQAFAQDVFLRQARDQSGTSWNVIVEDDRRNRTVGIIGHHRVQISRRDIKGVRTSFNQCEGKGIRKGYGIVSSLIVVERKLNADDVGIELMTERDLLKSSTTIASVRRQVITLGFSESSAATSADVETATFSTLTEYYHLLRGSSSDLQDAVIETIGTRPPQANEVWSC